jgi:arylsulfatase A-like enzyme
MSQSRRQFICSSGTAMGALALSGLSGQAFLQPKRPNVLYVFSDSHRAESMGCYGNASVRTPNFDAFARQGAILKTAMSTTPVCSPHRACLITGQYSHHHGMVTNDVEHFEPKIASIAETFRSAGSTPGYSGKWHLACPWSHLRGFGFPTSDLLDKTEDAHYPSFTLKGKDPAGRDTSRIVFEPAYRADQAIRFIESQSKATDPWMFFLSWIPPHPPFVAPPGFADKYRQEIQLQPNVPPGRPEEVARKSLPDYYGMIESLDVEFARILQALERSGAAEDTIVVYSSDHGEMIGSNGYARKRWPHDNSARVPFLIRYPRKIRPGQVFTQPFSTPDVYPTLAGLAGVKTPPGLDGLDYSSLLLGAASTPPRDYAFLQMMYGYVPWPGWRSLRTEEYMYARTVKGPWLLFDERKDPYETKNLVEERSARSIVQQMDRRLAAVMKETGDSWEYRVAAGDVDNWMPGRPKFLDADLGFDWPGKTVGS